ncbi:uncharacterized protein LOC131696345 [Topomyia yanbarensis]|uniref:uncharacterized protein LOC131696345 n=1 Tax=Topomyia yanbarensis TaxID=2498891 RepID=UPI00273CD540|nr:uncharacterized protein LOC131696345 [Topomyia yanbarensis]
MEQHCNSCAAIIASSTEVVTCKGFCKATFHVRCSQLSAEMWALVKSNSSIFWMCPGCRKLMSGVRFHDAFGSTSEFVKTVVGEQTHIMEDLKGEIRRNAEMIRQIVERLPSTPLNRSPWPMISNRPNKRPRVLIDSPQIDRSATEVFCGNRDASTDLSVPIVPVAPRESKFWLFLSRFSPSATVEEISKLVQHNLETQNPVDVVKLVKKDADLNQMTFVSFKVGLPLEMKTRAMQPTSWQKGIYFREFEDRGFRGPGRSNCISSPNVISVQ